MDEHMKQKNKFLRKIISIVAAAVIVVILWGIGYRYLTSVQTEGYDIVFFGDSLIGNVKDDTAIPVLLSKNMDAKILNAAFGGSCIASVNSMHKATVLGDSVNLCSLVDAIVRNDFIYQRSDVVTSHMVLPYFLGRVNELAAVDFNQVDTILIEQGTNDYNSGVPLEDENDSFNVETYGGALRYTLSTLQTNYPNSRIVLITPTYCYFLDENDNKLKDCHETDFGYGVLDDYVALELQIAREYNVEVIDMFQESPIQEDTMDIYSSDGLHFDENGRRLLAQILADYLKGDKAVVSKYAK